VFTKCHSDFILYGYYSSGIREYANANWIRFAAIDESNVLYSGECGEELTWKLHENGVLSIGGYGDMWDFAFGEAPWMKYADEVNIRSIQIEVGVTSIGSCAFSYLQTVYGVALPDTVNRIGYLAFSGCTGINAFTVPKNVTVIGESAFSGCTNMQNITLNGKLEQIADRAFEGCSMINDITFPRSLNHVGNHAFSGCAESLTFYGYRGSSAHKYAEANGIKFISIDPPGSCSHTFSEWTNVTAPGCNATGVLKRKCTLCGTEESQTTPALGHNFASTWTTDSEPTCTAKGSTSRHCLRCGVTTDIIYIEPKGHTFGAWVTDVVPTFTTEGSKSRICSACGIKETAKISKVEYDLEENPNFGAVNFRVVDFTTLAPVANINILCGDTCVVTDVNGKAYTVLPVGKHTVSVYGGDYNTRNLNITVDKGLNDLPDIGIGKKPIIEVKFDHKEMTIDEILDAGIDTKAEDNQHVFNYNVDFIFKPDVDYYNVNFYWSNGKLVDIKTEQLPEPPPGDDHGNGTYYPGAGPGFINPPIIHRPGPDEPYYPPYIEFPGTEGRPYPVMVYPVNERFYLVVHGSVKWLKEMYDIQMVILNNSLTDTVEDCVATLSLPDGLSLATMMPGYEQTLEQKVPFIDKGKTATVNWYVRGDKKGSYYPSATLSGKLMPFEEEFKYEYTTPAPLIVEAGSAMHMTIEAPSVAYYGEDYPIRITLENVSDMPIYSLCHTITSVEQFKLTSYSDGTKTKEEYVEAGGGSIEHDIFNPGEKVVVEVTSEIMFESDMIKQRFSNVTEFLDGIDTMLNAFEAYEKAAQTVSDIADILSAAKAKLEGETDTTDAVAALGELYTRCAEINGKSVAIASALKGSEYYYIIKKWGEGDGNVPVGELSACTAFMNKIIADTDVSENSYTFDTVTSLIYATPVKFLLDDVIVTTLEGSTTEIPYTVKITENPDTPIFFGTQNVGMLSYSYIVSLLGDVDIPLILKLLDLPDSEQGYKDAVAYLKSAKGQIERFAAKSATGKTSFRAWVEDPDGNKIEPNLDLHNLTLSEDGKWQMSADADFTMSCSNPEATYDDGVLSFEGAGFIDVIPHTTEGAILCVEMTEDGITKTDRYVLESADIHECSSTKWETVVPAFDGEGYRARICAECEDIIEIEAFGANVFDDVPTESWYHGAVQYAVTNNIMNGTSETSFSPENSLTRAMFITVLYRLAGSPEGETHSFTDLEKDSWYEAAVAWASSNGIVNGVEPGVFAPNNEITREQMATIVYRFAKYKNYDMQGAKSVDYSDKDDISSYAAEPVLWCSEKGIMKGNDDGTFMPGTHSTRAQAATVFMRLLTVFDK
ncbi:MAG: hypothetical protein E7583_05690, partial [Ruminococcaceae bacterium]|nr:hypothetical protein [Oscillospiraceae bacterium]